MAEVIIIKFSTFNIFSQTGDSNPRPSVPETEPLTTQLFDMMDSGVSESHGDIILPWRINQINSSGISNSMYSSRISNISNL